MRFPKTIRLDGSDARIFDPPAQPGEWAVAGGFAFADADPDALSGKALQAFANGMLGTDSFGWSTVVVVADIGPDEYDAVIGRLADHFVACYGAPDRAAALDAARSEAAFAASLCDHPANTLLTAERRFGEDGIVERFRVVRPPADDAHTKIWDIVPDDEPA